ncbi:MULTISPECIES: porin [Paraburkholderia]|jgi:predicted porin|uniref:Porin n=1 Tax=Paraburkholderia caribensis TaxID=75105 RepID=A0A9Q6S5A0_9BURK|nr:MULTISPECIES: porin [Paraburkholderia]AMV46625.1 porin [Paraburkholderia caribensis]MCO4881926.1 porin [Paraburkholderia caribensis]PTB25036.1 porin [Paraburkholderia caribensis]QLB65035.1 porin [Paraburkholderia caribensis]
MLFNKASHNVNTNARLMLGALAAAGVSLTCGTAHAQSSVTLYGIADVGIEHINNTSAGGAQTREVSGNLSGSRWGLKGAEDLGGGMKAIFQLENGFNINDGTTAQSTKGLGANATTTARLFGRQAWVGLSYKGQQLTFGRQNALLYEQAVAFDPMGASSRYSVLSLDYAMAARIDNSAKYTGVFGPLTAQAMYSTRYDTGYGAEVPGAEITGRFFSGALTFAQGPLAASVSYEQRNSNTLASNTGTERRATAAASYQIGRVKGFAGYRYLRASNAFLPANPIVVANGSEASAANLYWAGAQYFVTPAFVLTATGYYQDVHSTGADPWLAVLCADYLLSKRTDVYATAGFARNKDGSALGVNGYGTVAAGHNQTGVVIGMRQKF